MPDQMPLRILIAEDDAAIHEKIKSLVTGLGFTVAGDAYNGPQAVSLVKQLNPDVVLLDMAMPDPDSGREDKRAGFLATEAIMSQCPAPIVWITAYETPQMVAEASRLGVIAYLVKPPHANDMARAITLAHARFADMQELRRLNTALRQALDDKQLLMRELQHRIKNSLAMVVGFLQLGEENLLDKHSRAIFASAITRIYSMEAIYTQLYRVDGLDHLDLRLYIEDLVAKLAQAYLPPSNLVRIETEVEELSLDLNQALPVGIILNELITNALKYAFPSPQMEGVISVHLAQVAGEVMLTIADNGVGLSADSLIDGGMGMEFVKMLTHQLGGSFNLESGNGCVARVSFRLL